MNNIIILKEQLLRYILFLLGVDLFSIQWVFALCICICNSPYLVKSFFWKVYQSVNYLLRREDDVIGNHLFLWIYINVEYK